jgi:hypothetical protein
VVSQGYIIRRSRSLGLKPEYKVCARFETDPLN